jgi:transposase-like protein
MGQVLHGSARTTAAVRRAIQLRQESVRALAKRYGVSPTTVQKWRNRETTADAKMGPKEVRSTVLTLDQEAIVVAFRRHTLLPLDDCLYALQPMIPHLTRISRMRSRGGDLKAQISGILQGSRWHPRGWRWTV